MVSQVVLGFDFGLARIGVAIGETLTRAARPLCVVSNRQQGPDWEAIDRVITEWRPNVIIVGVPRHIDESASTITIAAIDFGAQLHARFYVPVVTIDERLSSWEATQRLLEVVPTRRRGRNPQINVIDAHAAAVILESWLNAQPVEVIP